MVILFIRRINRIDLHSLFVTRNLYVLIKRELFDIAMHVVDIKRRIIAAHLIELSGESFGTNAQEWQTWLDTHPNHTFLPNMENDSLPTGTNGAIDFGR